MLTLRGGLLLLASSGSAPGDIVGAHLGGLTCQPGLFLLLFVIVIVVVGEDNLW